jgi:hypothetical protein
MNDGKLKNGRPATDVNGVLAALRRARRRAEYLALATGTCIVEAVDGKPVRVPSPTNLSGAARKDEPDWK